MCLYREHNGMQLRNVPAMLNDFNVSLFKEHSGMQPKQFLRVKKKGNLHVQTENTKNS